MYVITKSPKNSTALSSTAHAKATEDHIINQILHVRDRITFDLTETVYKDIDKELEKVIMRSLLMWWDGQVRDHKIFNFDTHRVSKENYNPLEVYDIYLNNIRISYDKSIANDCDKKTGAQAAIAPKAVKTTKTAKDESMVKHSTTKRANRWKWRNLMEEEEFDLIDDTNDSNFQLKESPIHGLGLFATKIFQPNEFVIDYKGERVSSREANFRELLYRKQGQYSCYFFSLDTDDLGVIDATMCGNMARYINHSCDVSSSLYEEF